MLPRTNISGICSLEGTLGVLYSVLTDPLIDTIDARGGGSPRDAAIA
ncbi:MAG TPA: hypothetical protein VMU78_02515 [Methylocella sp.]|nr:hypothetical protein [Methylocella sp.]